MSHSKYYQAFYPLLAVLFFCAGVSSSVFAENFSKSSPQRLGLDAERVSQMDSVLQSYVDNEQIAGSVTMILRNGRIAYSSAKGMQNIEADIPMQEDSIFRIASQTKAIVATGIMMLHERGQLNIADPLARYLPEWQNSTVAQENASGSYDVVPANSPITLRQLLTHTSGIGYGMGGISVQEWIDAGISGWYFAGNDEPIRETVRRMAALPQQAHPGQQWIYGYNIDILGAVIEEVSGQNLADFLSNEILIPLGMEDTHFYLPEDKTNRLAAVYQPDGNGGVKARPETDGMQSQGRYIDGPRMSYSGGAGLLSTAENYARFLQMTLNGGEFNGVRLLSPKTVELMTSNHLGDIPFQAGNGMGLGFSILENLGDRGTVGSVGEYGWGGAYHSTYWVDPEEQLVVVYLTQIIPAFGLDDFEKLRATLYAAIVE